MNNLCFYEDRQGRIVDEFDWPEPMDYVIDEEVCSLQAVCSHTEYLRTIAYRDNLETVAKREDADIQMKETSFERSYTAYIDRDKTRLFKLMFENVLNASAAENLIGIHIHSAQRWAKQYENDPASIFKKPSSRSRSHILNEENKSVILECVDENPSIVLEQVMDQFLQIFEGLKVFKTTLHRFMKEECNRLLLSQLH